MSSWEVLLYVLGKPSQEYFFNVIRWFNVKVR